MTPTHATAAAIFDLDGVLTDTAELHFAAWSRLAQHLGLPFDRQTNDNLRGVGRMESLDRLLGAHRSAFSAAQKRELADRKNNDFRALVEKITPADLATGARDLLTDLRNHGFGVALASASKNARRVIERLGIATLFDAVVDGVEAPASKPDPQAFLRAAELLGVASPRCVVVEDAAAGVEAARRAKMCVIGIGPAARVGAADLVVPDVARLTRSDFRRLLELETSS